MERSDNVIAQQLIEAAQQMTELLSRDLTLRPEAAAGELKDAPNEPAKNSVAETPVSPD